MRAGAAPRSLRIGPWPASWLPRRFHPGSVSAATGVSRSRKLHLQATAAATAAAAAGGAATADAAVGRVKWEVLWEMEIASAAHLQTDIAVLKNPLDHAASIGMRRQLAGLCTIRKKKNRQ